MTPDAGAKVLSALEPYLESLAKQARQQGRHERREALAADALLAVAEHTRGCESSFEQTGPAPAVRVLVDHSALQRGEVAEGETCEIQGVGPIPAATAAGMLADSNLAAILADGSDIAGVSHLGRTINARLRTALEARDPNCVVPGCYVSRNLEIDHVVPFPKAGRPDQARQPCQALFMASRPEDPPRVPAVGRTGPVEMGAAAEERPMPKIQ